MFILNLTQHPATAEQIAAGVKDLPQEELGTLKGLLTFEGIPSANSLAETQVAIAMLAYRYREQGDHPCCMIGGAPFLMAGLEEALKCGGMKVLYAFSKRESEEIVQPDGSTKKVATFRHLGFVGSE